MATTLSEQVARSRADRSRGASAKADFLRRAAADGKFYETGSVDYLRLERADGVAADVVVPHDYRLDSVDLGFGQMSGEKGNSAVATATGGEVANPSAPLYPTGPGFETYAQVSRGSYQIFVYYSNRSGKIYFDWSKYKDQDTTHPDYELWAYKRWAVATPPGSPMDTVQSMGMRSYPTSASQNVLRGWNELQPLPGSYAGNCAGNSIGLNIANIGVSFNACQHWRVDWNDLPWNAGDMSFNWWQNGPFYQAGHHNMAALFSVQTFPGTTPYYKDFYKVKFYYAPTDCAATDKSANCYF
ncbi:hypothetical protein [Allorhizocola rhizosphaerae]|uniref:hypothetical protein n=1 Tax=Allorhizocola rhizosphaerae TaxID=1872709 RepID=UPI0013C37B7D|nr:hypothetical protein [Allorhizocola rhizosphaerae]